MIIIKNRELLIPNNEQFIGTVYDNNADTRYFKIDRMLNGQIDLSGFTFVADVKYSNAATDSLSLTKDEINEDYIVLKMTLPASVLSNHVGNMAIQVRCSDLSGRTWSSAPSNMYIMDQLSNPGAVVASTTLTELQQTETSIEASETLRIAAESARATAETGRVSAESSRVSAESSRVSAESGRVSAESARVSAESGRASAESLRVSAESGRASAESLRVSAESARVSAENSRVSAEASRVSAEAARAAEFDEKSLESEGWAKGTQNDVPVTSESPYYHDNSKYYSQQADADSLVAEGWAKGTQNGVEVTSESPYYHDNSKYYKEQAGQATVGFVSYATVQDLNATAKARARGNIDAYTKPASGIPSTDLTSAVQTSLNKADTALQEHQSLAAYRTSAAQDVIDTALNEDKADRVDVLPLINIWDEQWVNCYLENGVPYQNSNATCAANFIDVKDYDSIYIHIASNPIKVSCYDSNKSFVIGSGTVYGITIQESGVFNIPSGIKYIKFYLDTSSYGGNISINYPSTYHGYYPSRLAKVESRVTNRNLLDNPWFTVNQRGFTSGVVSGDGYFVDRWTANNLSITVNSDGSITLTNNSSNTQNLVQKLEANSLKENLYTLSINVVSYSGVSTLKLMEWTSFNTKLSTMITHTGINSISGNCSFNSANMPYVVVAIDSGASITIRAIKLELGTVSTLHMDTAPNYAEELLKCQRYYYKIQSSGYMDVAIGMLDSDGTHGKFLLHLNTEMASVPSLTFNNLAFSGVSWVTELSVHPYSTKKTIIFSFTVASAGTAKELEFLEFGGSDGYIALTADL